MKCAKPITILLFACVLAGAAVVMAADAPVPVGPDGTLLAGNNRGLWIVRNGDDRFGVFSKESGGTWQAGAKEYGDRIAAAAAIDDQLHALTQRGRYLVFSRGPGEGVESRELESGPLAVTTAPKKGPGGRTVLLAVADAGVVSKACKIFQASAATRPAAPPTDGQTPPTPPAGARAASGAAPPASIVGLLVLIYNEKPDAALAWEPVALQDGVTVVPGGRVLAATNDGIVYVMVANAPAGPNRLMAWANDTWREVSLTGPAAKAQVLGLCSVNDRLVAVLAEQAPGDATGRHLRLAILDAEQADGKGETHPVTEDKTVRRWAADALPAVTTFNDALTLFWKDGETFKLAQCKLDGDVIAKPDVEILLADANEGAGLRLYDRVLMGLMMAIIVMTFLRRPGRPTEPFILPPAAKPALMWRRVMAAMLDMLPFSILATSIFLGDMINEISADSPSFGTALERMRETMSQDPAPDNVIYSNLLGLALYTAYSTLMELRFGATLGKKLLKLRVVGHGGAKPTTQGVVLRNLVRALPLCWPILLPTLILFPLLNRYRQRLGDKLAFTAVIDSRGSFELPSGADGKSGDSRIGAYTEHAADDDDPPSDDVPDVPSSDQPPHDDVA